MVIIEDEFLLGRESYSYLNVVLIYVKYMLYIIYIVLCIIYIYVQKKKNLLPFPYSLGGLVPAVRPGSRIVLELAQVLHYYSCSMCASVYQGDYRVWGQG